MIPPYSLPIIAAMLALLLAATLALPPQKTDAVIGVSAVDLASGRRVSVRGDERFPMGSVYKFPIALVALRRLDLDEQVVIEPADFSPGWSPLARAAKGKAIRTDVRGLLRTMLVDSDNTACDWFIRRLGAATVTGETNVAGIRVDRTEKAIAADIDAYGKERYHSDPRDTSTPDAMVELLTRFARAPHPLALQFMTETWTGKRRIRAALPEGASLAHKTGTMPGVVNDVGLVTMPDGRRIALAVFTRRLGKHIDEQVEDDIAAVTRAVLEELVRPAR